MPVVSSQLNAMCDHSSGSGFLASSVDTLTRTRLLSVTKASRPWPFQSMRSQTMSQLLWSANPTRKMGNSVLPKGSCPRQ